MKLKYKFIHFIHVGQTVSQIEGHDLWSCRNNRSGEELGEIKWYRPWKQYCYFPTVQAVYSVSCFEDINDFIRQISGKSP